VLDYFIRARDEDAFVCVCAISVCVLCVCVVCVCCVRGDVCWIIQRVCSRRMRSYVCVLSDFVCVCVCAR